MQKHLLIFVALLSLTLAGCSTTPDDEKTEVESLTAQELTTKAKSALNAGNYTRAIELLEEIDTRYPFGRISEQVKLDLIFAYFKKGGFEQGQLQADRFIRQHPQHKSLAYVYYMKGVMYYEQEKGFFKDILSADMHKRDTSNLKAAFDSFKSLVQVYPESEYAPDARQRMIQIKNLLAQHELHIARFYMDRDSYVGAANRAKYIVEAYPKSTSVPQALEILVNSYKLLDIPELAEQYRRVLLLNYPDYDLAEF
ncbi:outer membrane protein assembly factor BamD [Kangiella sp. TOML190]|uniref:outer membrane protein assembly factor BamD n=1 Tax=Kangiella sp. TOML190 TaxID=2931351 RepID=UPI00203BE5AB|nr:outer membrane protein assembly factor BamD [Kangiella sp. TOML190]